MCLARELGLVGADVGYIGVPDPSRLAVEVARVTPHSERPVRLAFPVDAPYPLAAALRTGSELFIADNEQLRCDHPGLTRVVAEDHACATLPLRDDSGTVIGALNVGFEDPHEFTEQEREQIERIAAQCASALAAALRPA